MRTTVVHHRQAFFDVYIGRPSKWGNPFVIGRDGDRETVILKYKEWITQRIVDDPELLQTIKTELKGKVLGCTSALSRRRFSHSC